MIAITSCKKAPNSDANSTVKAMSDTIVWPPANFGNTFDKVQNASNVKYDWSFESKGMHGMNKYGELDNPYDENDVNKLYGSNNQKSNSDAVFKIKGEFYSNLGSLKVKATFNKWKKIMSNDGMTVYGWGPILTSGEVIVDKKGLRDISKNSVFDNSYSLSAVNDNYVMIKIDSLKNEQLLLLHSFNANGKGVFAPLPNTINTNVSYQEGEVKAHVDGWYYKDNKIVLQNSK